MTPCLTGWGPCPHIATGGHVCERRGGHAGRCRCYLCGASHTPPNEERAQLAALGETATPDALTVTVRRPPPAAGHFAD